MRVISLIAFAVACQGCTCARSTPPDPANTDAANASAAAALAPSDLEGGVAADDDKDGGAGTPRFSLPIAAARQPSAQRTFVAGLRVPQKAVTLALMDDDGHALWSADVFDGVSWSQDAELHVYGAADGAWVVWRGPIDKKTAQKARFVSGAHALSAPLDVAGGSCAVGRVLYLPAAGVVSSVEPGAPVTQMKLRDPDADLSIYCDGPRPLVLSESDDGAAVLVPEDGGITRFTAFNDDSEGRTTVIFAAPNRAGVLRIGDYGAVVRELSPVRLGPARAHHPKLSEDDDIVVVDVSAKGPVLFTAHDVESACDAGAVAAPALSAFILADPPDGSAFDAGSHRDMFDVAPFACGRERGPYWSGNAHGDLVFAWAERIRQPDKATAPIAGVGFTRLSADGAMSDHGFIEMAADGIVDASCDDTSCFAAALVRVPGDDDSKAESVRVFPLRTSQSH